MNTQSEFSFDRQGSGEGYARWVTGRKMAAAELAKRMGLPLGHHVEVWLFGGVRLSGRLHLREDLLFIDEQHARHLELCIDHATFSVREIESCVRLD